MIDYNNPDLLLSGDQIIDDGSVTWLSPSNLALVKYWGKHGNQLPQNPSVSLTLTNAFSETTIAYQRKGGISHGVNMSFVFEGKPNRAFGERIKKYLQGLLPIFPFLRQLDLAISSTNSFPHSSGIASSASSMSALALCLCSIEHSFFGTLADEATFLRKASFVARLGSGSASRSVYPYAAMWGAFKPAPESTDYYAIPMEQELHAVFKSFHNDILIVSSAKKAVSSSAGHQLMEGNLFAESRYEQAKKHLTQILPALKSGDVETMGEITELEALSLHALMMTSNYTLIHPNSLQIIEKVRQLRRSEKIPLYFSLDAGPNIHLLYPRSFEKMIYGFIESELLQFCEEKKWLKDRVGDGPLEKINK